MAATCSRCLETGPVLYICLVVRACVLALCDKQGPRNWGCGKHEGSAVGQRVSEEELCLSGGQRRGGRGDLCEHPEMFPLGLGFQRSGQSPPESLTLAGQLK